LLTRLISMLDLVLLNGSLLVFFIAFLLSLRPKTT
jgi:competence protein ComGF